MKNIVLKVGGSLLYQEDMRLNNLFLEKLKIWYEKNKEKINKLAIVVGGGKLSREVGKSAKGYLNTENIHSVAMQITQANAELVKGYLKDESIVTVQSLKEADDVLNSKESSVLISGGLKKGWSTDMDCAVFADVLGLKTVYKLSNVEGVYTQDPKMNQNAKLIKEISWKEYMELFNIQKDSKQEPNKSAPISPETAIFCQSKGITYFVSGGRNIYEKDDLALVFESGTRIF